ncbi:MAG: hypothetical protein V7K35_16570 [Nostoc sp.]|uniref:hypothetical protein n=1 Tax=Nostoc sp. TaxID=1180 RepID=UPI002FF8A8C6
MQYNVTSRGVGARHCRAPTGVPHVNDNCYKTYLLCDAVSFVLMRRQGIMEALTTDKHFEQEGFTRLLRSVG